MIRLEITEGSNLLSIKSTGKLEKQDYEQFGTEIENLIRRHGKIRVLMELEDFQGWTAGALWEDIKFDAKHFSDIERIAMVGDKTWEKGMAIFCKPFTTAKVRYFDRTEMDDARQWVAADYTE